jgi:hypothetical protein
MLRSRWQVRGGFAKYLGRRATFGVGWSWYLQVVVRGALSLKELEYGEDFVYRCERLGL